MGGNAPVLGAGPFRVEEKSLALVGETGPVQVGPTVVAGYLSLRNHLGPVFLQ